MVDSRPPSVPPARAIGLGRHYANYSGSTILMMVAGLVSFPALTRLLDTTQYGILGYFDTLLMIAVAVIKLGGQHAILRLYPFGGDAARMVHFATNLVLLPVIVSLAIWAVGVAALGAIAAWGDIAVSPVLWGAVLLLPMMVFISQVQMVLRASERSGMLAVTQVSSRWLEVVLILGAVIVVQRSALAVYAGKIAVALLMVMFYIHWVRRHLVFSRDALDPGAYRASLRYSLPLVANEMAGAVLVSIDRVMLKSVLGDFAAVGVYTIGCALALQVSLIMNDPLFGVFKPAANRIHDTQGPDHVRALKARVLVPVTYASIGVAVAIWVVGGDVLVMFTGPAHAASAAVFVWLGVLFALLPMLDVSGYGLLLQKRTMTVLTLTVVAAALNIGLNLLWIPMFGVMGSVYATVVSYMLLSASYCVFCPRGLLQLPDARSLLVAGVAAAIFTGAVAFTGLFGLVSPWMRAFAGGGLWLVCYVVPSLLLDQRLRTLVFDWRGAKMI